jgi:type IV pilus assembly protein PilX
MLNTNRLKHAVGRTQRGMSLLFSLLALAALSLAAVALVRSVNTSSQVIGNLGFKQDATSAGSRATESAIAWILANPTLLETDNAAAGYYATALDSMDPTGRTTTVANPLGLINWDSDGCAYATAGTFAACSLLSAAVAPAGDGNSSRYLISRLCQSTGPQSSTNVCAKPAGASLTDAVQRGEIRVGTELRPTKLSTSPYYRIIVRTVGARNTVSFTETIVHF